MSTTEQDDANPARAARFYGSTTPSTNRRLGAGGEAGPKEPDDPRAAAFYGKTTPSEKGGKVAGSPTGWYTSTTPAEADPRLVARSKAQNRARRG